MIRGDRVDSIGTCSFCGYYGPGPQHECKPAIPAWLDRVLLAAAVLDLHHPDARAKLADSILEAVPGPKVAAAIAKSARTVLDEKESRNELACPTEDRRRISREVGNNAAQAVLAVLGGDE